MTGQPRSWLSENVAGIILAGGRNSRMGGRDKAFLQVNGETVFARTLGLLKSCFEQVVVVSNHPEKYANFDVDVTSDEMPGLGPLGGLHAGLGHVRAPYAFVTACDMPFLSVEPIRFLVSHLSEHDAVIPCWAGDIEPLHAIYATALRPRIAEAVASGSRAIRDFLPQVRVYYVAENLMADVDGAEEAFRNVNTPEEAARFEVQVRG
jgi:molybdopterin-guanine dinucleotide biosynthesis protein A